MSEKDNFNLAGYLRKNTLMNEAFEGFGGYKDLNPLKEEETENEAAYFAEAEEGEANAWMSEVDGTEAYTVGEWKCYFDHPGILAWSYGDIPFDKFSVYATPGWEDPNTTPIQVDVNQDTVDNMSLPQGTFVDFGEYAAAMGPALQKIESEYSDDMTDGSSMNELEKPEKIYADEEDDELVDTNRMMDLGGEAIERGIIHLIDDGFDAEDILDMCKMFIDAHSEAAEQGKKFEGQINESEVDYRIINGKCYRVDDEGNRDEVSMARCR